MYVETDFLNENSAGKDLQGPSQTANVIYSLQFTPASARGTIYIRERHLYQGKILIYIFNHIYKVIVMRLLLYEVTCSHHLLSLLLIKITIRIH